MAAELGELVLTMEADDLRLKKQLKGAEKLTKKSADSMAKSLDKVKASSVDTSQAFSVLEKAAAATGLTWLSQIKSMGELVFELVRVKTSLGLSASAYTVETVAVGKNTIAMTANTAARTAQRAAITAMTEPWEGLARARTRAGVAARGVRPARVTVGKAGASTTAQLGASAAYTQRARLAQLGKGLMTAGKVSAIAGAALAVGNLAHQLWGLWKVRKKNAEVLEKSQELEGRLSLRMQATRDATEKQMSTLRRQLQVARKGLTGAAAHEVMQRGTKKDVVLDMELRVMRVQERRLLVAANHARKDQERTARLQEQLATEERLTAEKKRQAELTRQQNIAARAARIAAGVGSPYEMGLEAERLMNVIAQRQNYLSETIKRLETKVRYPGDLASQAIAQLKGATAATPVPGIGGRGMLVSAREVAGMPVPRLGAGGAGGRGPQSLERKGLKAQEETAKNTRRIADAVQQGMGMAA